MSRMAELAYEQERQEAERDLEMAALAHHEELLQQEQDLYEAERKVREILKTALIRPLYKVEIRYLIDHTRVAP